MLNGLEVLRLNRLEPGFGTVDPVPNHKVTALTVIVVTCTCNRPANFQKGLATISDISPGPDQVLVVDNSSGDKPAEKIAQQFSMFYVIEPVRGFSSACIRGHSESRTYIIASLDDDAVPDLLQLNVIV